MLSNELSQIGYVVSLEGTKIRINLLEGYKGQLAAHRSGINSVSQPGDLIGFEAGRYLIVARVTDMSFVEPEKAHAANFGTMNVSDVPLRQIVCHAVGHIKIKGDNREFISENWMLPPLGAKAIPLDKVLLNSVYGLKASEIDHSLLLGRDTRTNTVEIRASVNMLLSRHLAVLGSTGYGKSNFNALLTRQIVEQFPNSRIVIFDINGEYAQAFEGLTGVKQTILGSGDDNAPEGEFSKEHAVYHKIPYQALGWAGLIKLLRPSDKTQLPALRNALSCLTRVYSSLNTGEIKVAEKDPNGDIVTFTLEDDCNQDCQGQLGLWLNKLRKGSIQQMRIWPPFRALANLVAEFGCVAVNRNTGASERNAFNYGNVLPLIKIIQQLSDDSRFKEVIDVDGGQDVNKSATWSAPLFSEVDYIFGCDKEKDQDWRVHIINLKNLADDLSPMVLGSLLEMYSEVLFKRGQQGNYPTLLLLEEAHQYLRDPYVEESNQLKAYERLAKEGRKFSCSLLVSTQRPSELSSTVLAMCSNWISLRLTNERDLMSLRYAMENGNEHVLNEISGLPRGDAVGFGSAFNLPLRFTIDKAVPGPASTDANFVEIWKAKNTA
ncbi:ATP-binding protein [Photobacterium sp. J15]|uniref:ATP-binding protein n=1 Tax=Photobacterium sp. J15 TaxID=265901 RepID=UPI0007E30893|nr:ATP-binding protein [Photobacterium sp. J15]